MGFWEPALQQALPLMVAVSEGAESLTCSSLMPAGGASQPPPTNCLKYDLILTEPCQPGIPVSISQTGMLRYKLSGLAQGHTAGERPGPVLEPAFASLAVKPLLLHRIPISSVPVPLCPQPSFPSLKVCRATSKSSPGLSPGTPSSVPVLLPSLCILIHP